MPLYEYQCEACGKRFEVIQKYADPPIATCPTCGGPAGNPMPPRYSPEDRYRAMERLRPQPIAISTTPLTLTEERYGSVPRWYIECTRDNAVRIARQRAMVKDLPCKVITLEHGHTPFYSAPEELVEHLDMIGRS